MVFTNKKNSITPMNISIDRCSIEKVKCTKFLGVYIDDKLTWKKHITYITSKASSRSLYDTAKRSNGEYQII